MKFEKSVKKVFTSKYFLYFLLFLSITNLLGYLMMKNFNAIALFLIVGVLMHYFSKNMAVILLVCLVVTNLLMSRSFFKEGMENSSDSTTATTDASTSDSSATDSSSNNSMVDSATPVKDKVKNAVANVKDKVAEKKASVTSSGVITGPQEEENDSSMATLTSSEATTTPQGADAFTTVNGAKPDYAATITDSYKNLNNLLDPDAIKSLTQETMALMQEQQKLYKSMEAMSPLLGQAQTLIKGIDINNLKGLGGLIEKFSAAKV